MLLSGKKALILGLANKNSIAFGVAKAFLDQGASLAFGYPGEALKKRVEPLCSELGGDFCLPLDVTNDAEIAEAAQTVRQAWGRVDILVHSVAFANREDLHGRFLDTSRAGFALALDVSAFSLVAVCRAFEELLVAGSTVVAMTYNGSQRVLPGYNVMGVAKAALEASVRYLASEMGPKGVRVNALSPGPIKTLAASAVPGFGGYLPRVEEGAPLRRNVTPDDVGQAALFLASDLSRAVTGEIILVDNGYNIMGA